MDAPKHGAFLACHRASVERGRPVPQARKVTYALSTPTVPVCFIIGPDLPAQHSCGCISGRYKWPWTIWVARLLTCAQSPYLSK